MRTNPLSKAKELAKRVTKIVTAYLEGISSDTAKKVWSKTHHLCMQLRPPPHGLEAGVIVALLLPECDLSRNESCRTPSVRQFSPPDCDAITSKEIVEVLNRSIFKSTTWAGYLNKL